MFVQAGRKKELYDALLLKIEMLGRKPSYEEVKSDSDMAEPNDYAYYFGSFSNALSEAWGEYIYNKGAAGRTASIVIKKPIKH